jgi:hypothetical protein
MTANDAINFAHIALVIYVTHIVFQSTIIIIIINIYYNCYSPLAVMFYWLFVNCAQQLGPLAGNKRKWWMRTGLQPSSDGKPLLQGSAGDVCVYFLNNLSFHIRVK